MVTVINYAERQNSDGETFYALIVQGDMELITSETTGQVYATARRSSISTSFDESICKSLIGQQLPGQIERIDCEPYDFTIPNTGEVITLTHRWVYSMEKQKEEVVDESVVF